MEINKIKHFTDIKDVTDEDGDVLLQMSEMHTNHPRYENELMFYQLLRSGNVAAISSLLDQSDNMQLIVGHMSGNQLRQTQYTAVVLISVCTRVAISSGLDEETAYSFSDETIQLIDKMAKKEDILLQMSSFLIRICKLIARQHKCSYSFCIQSCLNYISSRLYQNITLTDLSNQCHLSPNYLCSLFTKEVGTSPLSYAKQLKLQEAACLILKGNHTLSEISNLLCFSSQSHFTREFHKYFGCPPGQYYKHADRDIFI